MRKGGQVQELGSPSPPPVATRTADRGFLSQVQPFSPTASPPFRAPIAPQHQFPPSGLKVIFSREQVREILGKAENLPWSAVLPDRGHTAIPPPPPHPHWGRYKVLQSLIHQTKVRDRTVKAKGQARPKGDGALRWASTHIPAGPSPHNWESRTGPVAMVTLAPGTIGPTLSRCRWPKPEPNVSVGNGLGGRARAVAEATADPGQLAPHLRPGQ